QLEEGTVVAIAAKIVSLCEGRAIPMDAVDKDELIAQESSWYLPRTSSRYNVSFTITRNMLIPTAGIDESNANDHYILWPKDVQESANRIRKHLQEKYKLKNLGVIITDSTTRPMQWGTTGIAVAFSGFKPLKDYIGTDDIFGRTMQFQKSNIANGLAAAAVLLMGEGSEQTPLCVISDLSFIEFQDNDPTAAELESLIIAPEDDLYAPFLTAVDWQKGQAS
ncbi:MAG: putative F420-0--gamma-glutamyl ligase, partial [Candidatus Saccharibacteria bacterium]|nr:putative F420-0--gamma-glutamyl ligase [Candidatus Saccharibacteria bacterium]